jgi:hypothetical protein
MNSEECYASMDFVKDVVIDDSDEPSDPSAINTIDMQACIRRIRSSSVATTDTLYCYVIQKRNITSLLPLDVL